MPLCHGIFGGMTLGSEGDGKMKVFGYFENGTFRCPKKLSDGCAD
jgi:hypothetical protein